MADISAEVKKFREAIYGEEVRESMISLAEKVNKEGENTAELAKNTSKKVDEFGQEVEKNKEDLTTLRDDYSTDIESLEQNSAPPIILTATGEAIALEDSADRRVQGLRIFGKTTQVQTNGYQLFDASKLKSKTAGGATVTNNGDGSFTVSGSGNLTETFSAYYELSHEETIQILKAGRISVANNAAHPSLHVYLYYDSYKRYYNLITDTMKYTDITDEMLSHPDCVLRCYMYGYTGKAIKPGTIKPMLYQDGDGTWESYTGGKPSPSPGYPQEVINVGDNSEIEIRAHGKNLFDITKIKSKTLGGVTVTINEDQTFTIKGKGSIEFNTALYIPHKQLTRMFKAGKLNLKVMNVNGGSAPIPRPYFCLYRFEGSGAVQIGSTLYHGVNYYMRQEYLDDETVYGEIGIYQQSSQISVEGTFKVMLYQDGDGTWEPYKPLQSFSLQTPNGLPGIKVESGGNYTDQTGQQWLTDEIDLRCGVYVQRVKEIKLKAVDPVSLSPQINNSYAVKLDNPTDMKIGNNLPGISNAFILSKNKEKNSIRFGSNDNNIYLYLSEKYKGMTANNLQNELNKIDARALYIIATPVETPLAEETLQAYKALHTNYPSTVISNDENAGMEVSYIADTKNYIDKKFKELNQAIVNTQIALL